MSDELIERLLNGCNLQQRDGERAVARIRELEAKLAQAISHIEWFISEDDTNRGDEPLSDHGGKTWNEINAYWLANLDAAKAFVDTITTQLKAQVR